MYSLHRNSICIYPLLSWGTFSSKIGISRSFSVASQKCVTLICLATCHQKRATTYHHQLVTFFTQHPIKNNLSHLTTQKNTNHGKKYPPKRKKLASCAATPKHVPPKSTSSKLAAVIVAHKKKKKKRKKRNNKKNKKLSDA